jgi:hypothetical protein
MGINYWYVLLRCFSVAFVVFEKKDILTVRFCRSRKAQSGCRIVLHVANTLMHGRSLEEPIFHYSLPADEISKSVPLIEFAHGATSLVGL